MLSKTAQYAVKAVLYLAKNTNENQKILASELASKVDVPKAFLAKILQQLSVKDYVSSAKGPNGGFYLNADQLENSVYDIILQAENRDIMGHCTLNLENCNELNPCPLHFYIVESKSALKRNLEQVSLQQFVETP